MRARPRLVDNDQGEISVMIGDAELYNWSYENDAERRVKTLIAQAYIDGWQDCGIWLAMSSSYAKAYE